MRVPTPSVFLVLVLVIATLHSAAADERFYVVGAVLHVGDGQVIEDAVLEVAGSRIVGVSGSDAPLEKGVAVIDVGGHVVTPGFIAAASQLGLVEISIEPATRDSVRTTGGLIRAGYDPAPAVNAFSSLIPVQAVEGITSAAVTPLGALLSGQVAFIDLVHGDPESIVVARRIAVRGALESHFEGSRAAALTRLRQALDDARFLAANRERFDRGEMRLLSAHPLDLEALVPVLAGETPLVMWSDRAGDILALVELANEYGVRLVIEGGAEAWRVADTLAEAEVSVILTPTHNLPVQLDALGARLEAAALLDAAGVAIGIVEEQSTHNARNVRQEAGIAIAYGLDRTAALRAVTLGLAEIYGVAEEVGSLEAGKAANFVVWDGDPFELSTAAARVFIRGREIPLVSRQTLLRDRYLDRIEREAGR